MQIGKRSGEGSAGGVSATLRQLQGHKEEVEVPAGGPELVRLLTAKRGGGQATSRGTPRHP